MAQHTMSVLAAQWISHHSSMRPPMRHDMKKNTNSETNNQLMYTMGP